MCSDFEDPDYFWINDGTGTFQAAPRLALRATSNAAMAMDFADIDRDGDVDFFEADMLSRDHTRRQMQRPSHTALPKLVGQIENRPQLQRNTLFLNRGDGTFAQIAEFAGVDASDWSWATLFLDVDLDGYEDILVANGHIWDVQNADTDERIRSGLSRVDWRRRVLLYPDLHQRNVAFRNNGDLTFDDVSDAWGFGQEADVSHGLAAGDLDGDGDLDVVINRLGFPTAVLRNNGTARRVAVRLRGQPPNTQGVGAKIRLLGGAVPEQEREVTAGGHYLSGSDPQYAFAAGDADSLTLVVEWRSGGRTVIEGVRPNRLYEIRESPTTGPTTGDPTAASAQTAPFFQDVSAELGHRHVETLFDEFARQPLLPNELSRLGPGITWYDVDRDGDEDLLIPSGRGGRLAYYRNDGGRFTAVALGTPEVEYDQTAIVALPDGVGGTRLLVGQSNYEAGSRDQALAAPSVLQLELGPGWGGVGGVPPAFAPAVPGHNSSTGPLALADVDGDGDLDLFVGGRGMPASYPTAATSRLFRNEQGQFRLDQANQAAFTSVGLVSAATFSDLDADGDPDLLLALEWGPLTLFVNEGGSFTDATASAGLARHRSRWNGVTTGDLDGDGRLDIVATSWGRNTRHRPDTERPLQLYYGDFDRNGKMDPILAQRYDGREVTVPLAPYFQIRGAMPATRVRVRSFMEYAAATLDDVLGMELEGVAHLEATTLDHTVFLNRGASFEPAPLPLEAQLAPAFYAGVVDFDGDGHEDLFLSQNFFPTEAETPRYDAGRGLWLRGDASGTLTPVPGRVSGVAVYGDQRGAAFADYDGNGKVDLVVSQNGAETKLYRNDGATPGIRIRLQGPPGNPHGIGATIRLVYAEGRGPAREVHAGSGYWSHDGAVQVLGMSGEPTGVWVRWPGGSETTTPVPAGLREITVRMGGR
ncbi:MAG: hypothetical protein GTN62_05405 [Gemmatimonadales bacterium]|nr:hypothetical protein [Gemmatimonadales bacterium]NIP06998.1 hypothetical protein [Gemmatimonadales bacterium]NIS63866.1 hypothetical protein [Gemmatimonadales bacterium]